MAKSFPQNIDDAIEFFSREKRANAYLRSIRWKAGKATCPYCEADADQVGFIASRNKYQCKSCRKQWSDKLGTIFEGASLPMSCWLVAVWAMADTEHWISTRDIAKAIRVPQCTAWSMMNVIRTAMEIDTEPTTNQESGWKAFDSLARRMASIPRSEVTDRIKAPKEAK